MIETVEYPLQVLTQGRGDGYHPVTCRIAEFNPVGMQEQTPQSKVFHETVEIGISVFQVTRQRMTDVRGMDTYLVCSARSQLDIHQDSRSVG